MRFLHSNLCIGVLMKQISDPPKSQVQYIYLSGCLVSEAVICIQILFFPLKKGPCLDWISFTNFKEVCSCHCRPRFVLSKQFYTNKLDLTLGGSAICYSLTSKHPHINYYLYEIIM